MNPRSLRVLVLTMVVAVLAMTTVGRAGAASAPHESNISAPEPSAGSVSIPLNGVQSGVPLFIGVGVASGPGIVLTTSWNDFADSIHAPSPALAAAVYEFFALGGLTAFVLPVTTEDAPAFSAALRAVTPVGPAAPQWDLIVIPALGSLSPVDWLTTAVHMTATASAAQATALLDPPDETVFLAASGETDPMVDVAVQLKHALASPANAALVSSDLTGIVSPLSVTQPTVVSGAAVTAGLIAQADTEADVWSMPGGPAHPVGGLQPVLLVDDALQNVLESEGSIDAWRVLPGYGTVLFGDLTLQGSGFDKWLTRSRTTSWISRSIEPWLRNDVFAADAPPLWSTVDAGISTFLTGVWKAGGLSGADAADGFTVTVGLGQSMTAQDVAEGLLKVNVQLNIGLIAPPLMTFQQQVQPGP